MSNYYEATATEVTNEDEEVLHLVLDDGRKTVHHDGVDHRASPLKQAKCIRELEKKMTEGQELVEVVLGDDCLWWAVVEKSK